MAKRGFEEATRALSGYIVAGRAGQGTATLDDVGKVCSILGIDLGRLSAIHVAGTKGKGSTSGTTLFREPARFCSWSFCVAALPGAMDGLCGCCIATSVVSDNYSAWQP